MYEVTIKTIQPISVAAMRHLGPYQDIGPVFRRMTVWAAGRGLLGPGVRLFGISYDDPGLVAPAALRSDAAILVPDGFVVDDGASALTIAGGRYATIIHKGPYAELEQAYRWLCGTWLPKSGEERCDHPCVEEYLNDPGTLPPSDWLTEISLPIR